MPMNSGAVPVVGDLILVGANATTAPTASPVEPGLYVVIAAPSPFKVMPATVPVANAAPSTVPQAAILAVFRSA